MSRGMAPETRTSPGTRMFHHAGCDVDSNAADIGLAHFYLASVNTRSDLHGEGAQ